MKRGSSLVCLRERNTPSNCRLTRRPLSHKERLQINTLIAPLERGYEHACAGRVTAQPMRTPISLERLRNGISARVVCAGVCTVATGRRTRPTQCCCRPQCSARAAALLTPTISRLSLIEQARIGGRALSTFPVYGTRAFSERGDVQRSFWCALDAWKR
jgi:hypothetical protein